MAKEELYHIALDDYEHGIVIRSLNDEKTDLMNEGKSTDAVDDLIHVDEIGEKIAQSILRYFHSEKNLQLIELTKVYRQTDQVFVSVLDHIRTNTAGNADLQLLNTRYTPTPPCLSPNHHESRLCLFLLRYLLTLVGFSFVQSTSRIIFYILESM